MGNQASRLGQPARNGAVALRAIRSALGRRRNRDHVVIAGNPSWIPLLRGVRFLADPTKAQGATAREPSPDTFSMPESPENTTDGERHKCG